MDLVYIPFTLPLQGIKQLYPGNYEILIGDLRHALELV